MKIRLNAVSLSSYVFVFCLVLLLVPAGLYAQCQITLSWDSNTPTPDGYRLYQRVSGASYNYNYYTDIGLSTTAPVSGLADNTSYAFVVRAYVGGQESGNSNEVTYYCAGGTTGGTTSGSSSPPLQPIAIAPSDNAQDVSLRPTLTTSTFIDHDIGDFHAQTRWMIYRLDNDTCVFDNTSSTNLTRITVPPSILQPFTSYYWSVCYFDQSGNISAPSQACDFTTLQAAAGTDDDTPTNTSASLSTSSSGGGSAGGGSGSGCFIQTLFGIR
jgi:hypothetical protein